MPQTPSPTGTRSPRAIPLGFAYIYFAWGATYLGVKWALTGLPVFLMSGGRFFLAGALLLLAIFVFDRRAFRRGTMREWIDAGKIGLLLLVFGIGAGNVAQQYIDSSLAAMVFSGLPLWIILIDWIRPGGRAPSRTVALGLLLGFIGIGVILSPSGHGTARPLNPGLILLLLMASVSWATGAVFSRLIPPARGSSLLSVARQMVVAGIVLLAAGCLHGDLSRLHLARMDATAWTGFAYLVLIGSFGGYPVYLWLIRVCPPAKAATVPYVNLIVAVFLGWSLGHETLTARTLLGTALVLVSVTIVLRTNAAEVVVPAEDSA
jgi:drug/metabolite transporter (DMT)-like permease